NLGRGAHAERQIRRTLYLRDVHDGLELCTDRSRTFRAATQAARHAASLPLHWLSRASRNLRGAGQFVGTQRRSGKKKRDAGRDGDCAAGSTILSLLEAAEESRRGERERRGKQI